MSNLLVDSNRFEAAIYLGSYPYAKGDYSQIRSLIIQAEYDLLVDIAPMPLPGVLHQNTIQIVTLLGGNHAQFGDYGLQRGDGVATIDTAEQILLAVQYIDSFLMEANDVTN